MSLSAVPRLPTSAAIDGISKSCDFGSKLPRGSLLGQEDPWTFTPRPIKAASVMHHEGSTSPSDPSSPSTSENSFVTGSVVSFNGNHAWASRTPVSSLGPNDKNLSPFSSPSYRRGLLVALVEQTLASGDDKMSHHIRRVRSAPLLAVVPEEQASLAAIRSSFAGRPAFSTDGSRQPAAVPDMPPSAPEVPAAKRVLKPSFSAPARTNNVVRGMVVTPSEQELNALFQNPDETVVCEIRIPGLELAGANLARIQTSLVFEEEWDLPLEEFPFSPKPGSVPMPIESKLEEEFPAPASCGLMALFRRASSKKQ